MEASKSPSPHNQPEGKHLIISAMTAAVVVALLAFAAPVPAQEPGPPVSPQTLSATFADIARMVEPSVVNIDSKGRSEVRTGRGPDTMRLPTTAVGSGFIVDPRGYILTNHHVVDASTRITVRLLGGEEYTAEVVGFDEETDIAVIRVDAGRPLPAVRFGDSDAARIGDWVLAMGSPFGLEQTVTAGIVSQLKRETPYASIFQKFIQTDAAINRGNSGGPLVNMKGEVIGVNSQIATSTGDYNGIGFALPSRDAERVYRQIVADGKVRRGFLGVGLESVRSEFAKVYGLGEARGAIITELRDAKSAAAVAGLKVGDVIVEIDGKPVADAGDMIARVAATRPDETIEVGFFRESGDDLEKKFLAVKLSERPVSDRAAGEPGEPSGDQSDERTQSSKPFGLTVVDIDGKNPEMEKYAGTQGIIVREVNPSSFIADVKLRTGADAVRRGDVIQRINRARVVDVKSFSERVSTMKKGDPVVLQIISFDASGRLTQTKIVQFTVK